MQRGQKGSKIIWVIFIGVLPLILVLSSGCAIEYTASFPKMPKILKEQGGVSTSTSHYRRGNEYFLKQQYDKAIVEYREGISKGRAKEELFGCYTNIGIAYMGLGRSREAYRSFHKAIEIWPARAYYPYINLAELASREGKVQDAARYYEKAYPLVQSREYEQIERKQGSPYAVDALKNKVIADHEFFKMMLVFGELEKKYSQKNYKEVELLAEEILNKKYHVSMGIEFSGNFVKHISDGSIAEANGIIKGDQILEIDGTMISNTITALNGMADLFDRFGDKVRIKIKRKQRDIPIICHLYYPELQTAQQMLNEARNILSKGKAQDLMKDLEPPQLLVLKPERKRGIRVVAKKKINLVILVGDNVGVKTVTINEILCEYSEASILEKTFLDGEVKKYTTKVSLVPGNNTWTIKAIDTSDNEMTKQITVTYTPTHLAMEQGTLYEHSIAVVIGINKYSVWPSLEFAVSDARAIKDKLYALGFDRVIELYDQEATRLQILRLLGDKLPHLLEENDRLMIFFAGHGQTETIDYEDKQRQVITEKEGYIIPVDSDRQNYRGTAISMSTIHEISKKYKAKHILYTFDSCYSGLGLKRSGGTKKADDYIRKLSAMKAVQIITAGGEDEQVGEEKGHGIFTKHLLLALDGKADLDGDGFITASEIGTYIRPAVSRKTENAQTPRYGWMLGEGDFIFETN